MPSCMVPEDCREPAVTVIELPHLLGLGCGTTPCGVLHAPGKIKDEIGEDSRCLVNHHARTHDRLGPGLKRAQA